MPTPRSHRFTRAVAGALVITAIATPGAGARPIEEMFVDPRSGADQSRAEAAAPTVTRTIDERFGWGSAAIGAGGATAVLLLTAAGASALSHRHQRAVVR